MPETHTEQLPKYIAIKDALIRGICNGSYPPGTYLPSESNLGTKYNASRVTIRMALNLLREMHLVEGQQGKGYFVQNIKAEQDLGRLQGFGEVMAAIGIETTSKVINSSQVAATAEVADALKLSHGTPVTKIERLRVAADVTMSLDVSFFPTDIGEQLLELDLAHCDVFSLIEDKIGVPIGYADIDMEIVKPTRYVRENLNLCGDQMVVRIQRLSHDETGRPIDFEFLHGRLESQRYKLRVARW